MRFVFVLSELDPRRSANTSCALAVANVLTQRGYSVVVVSTQLAGTARLAESMNVYFLSQDSSANEGKSYARLVLRIFWESKLVRKIGKLIGFNTLDRVLVRRLTKRLQEVIQPNDVVMPVCFPMEAVVAARRVSATVSCHLCPLLYDLYAGSDTAHVNRILKHIKMSSNKRLEKLIFEASSRVFCSESWVRWVEENGWASLNKHKHMEHPLLREDFSTKTVGPYYSGLRCCVLIGGLSTRVRNPRLALSVLSLVFEQNKESSLRIYPSGDCQAILREFESDQIHVDGYVETARVASVLHSADCFVIVGNSDVRQVQSKVYELISTGKPIIFFMKDRRDPILPTLQKYGNCLLLDENEPLQHLASLVNSFLKEQHSVISYEEIHQKFSSYSPEAVVDGLLSALPFSVAVDVTK